MNKKIYILIILCLFNLCSFLAASTIIAQVGENTISFEQLAQEMRDLEDLDNLSYNDLRNIAVENLVGRELLLIYGQENNINVDDEELDSFFIDRLGDLPRFKDGDYFDFDKYETFKTTENGLNILKEMKREILIRKAKTFIYSSFNITDEILLKEYILANAEIDISYSIVNVDQVNVTEDFSFMEATNYFYNNPKEFQSDRTVKFEFFIVSHSEFKESALSYYELVSERLIPNDSLYTETQMDSLKYNFINQETRKRSIKKARQQSRLLKNEEQTEYPIFTTEYLAENETVGNIPNLVTRIAMQMNPDMISEPLDIGIGYLVLRVLDFQEPHLIQLEQQSERVWNQYVTYRKDRYHENQFREYFSRNIDDFIIPVAVVKTVKIKKPIYRLNLTDDEFLGSIKEEIKFTDAGEDAVSLIAQRYNLQEKNIIIMLEKFSNQDSLKDNIAKQINNGEKSGFINSDNRMYYYTETTYFPEYIPRFSKIKDQIQDIQFNVQMNENDYHEFYDNHKKEFKTPDSLQLGIAYFLVENDTIEIDSSMVYEYYRDNLDSFYRDVSVEFDYIACNSREDISKIRTYLKADADFELVKFCYNQPMELPNKQIIEYKKLPLIIADNLKQLENSTISQPIEYQDKWLILKRLRSYSEGVRGYAEVKAEIAAKISEKVSRENVYKTTKTVFDSTSYYSQCFSYADTDNIFKSELQSVEQDFPQLGNLSDNAKELMRFYRNEKYSSIIHLPDRKGYAVIYILRKKPAKQMDFETALPQIKNIFIARKAFQTARSYVIGIREKILQGENPNNLLFFHGGWKREQNLDLNSQIFGPEWSKLILDDIANHEEGYFSPVLNLSETQLLFYEINRLKKILREKFLADKDTFRNELLENLFKTWLEDFKKKIGVEILL